MSRIKWKPAVAAISICLLFLTIQCDVDDDQGGTLPDHEEDPLEPKAAVTTSVVGVIIDENGQPVKDAEVDVHGETAMTGADGTFLFHEIEVPGNRCVIRSRKSGYFPGTRALTPRENGQTETRIVMMASPVTHTFEASAGTNAALGNGSEVHIPANGVVDEGGTAHSGAVAMSVRYLDPTAGNFGVLVPGGDMLARRDDERTSVLYSYGILRVQMTDLAGNMLQLAPGYKSTLIMSIPPDQQATAPAVIPLWYFDEEAGVWQEEGSAQRDGNRYVGTVEHFTDWNCDDPTEGATIVGRLVDCDNKPAYGIVEFGQITSDPQSSTTSDESSGRFERRVPDGVQLTVVISDPLMIAPLTQNERGKVIVIVPPLAPGQVYDVGDIQTFPCPSTVTATFNLGDGDYVENIAFETQNGYQGIYLPGTNLNTNLPPDITVNMSVYTRDGIIAGKRFQTAGEKESLDLGVIDLTQMANVGDVQIHGKTVCYGEVENEGQISVSWNGTQNSGINYTSPDADGSWTINAPLNATVEISSSTEHGTWTKTLQTPATPTEVVDLGIMELCENKAVGETSFRITGDGMNNALINVNSNKNSEWHNMGAYYPGENVTLAVIQDLTDQFYVGIIFPGNTTGVRQPSDELAVTVERKTGTSTLYYWAGFTADNSQLNFEVTEYGAVGGIIQGTFSGKFLVQDINKQFTGETVTITDGKFSVVRYPDIE